VAAINDNYDVTSTTGKSNLSSTVWPAATVSLDELHTLPLHSLVVETGGNKPALEQARTTLEVAMPGQLPPSTLGEITEQSRRLTTEVKQMTDVVIDVSLVIAGCSLAVSVTAGINDRKRPFSLLRLTGVPLNALRNVVALEAAVPLLVISVLSVGMGFLAAGLFLNSQLHESLRAPGSGYYLIVAAGLAASLTVIASTFPLIQRITGPEIARNE
jgi:hypothetical protein